MSHPNSVNIQEKWSKIQQQHLKNRATITEMLSQIHPLLHHAELPFVQQGLTLLCSFGEEHLCEILDENDGQLCLKSDYALASLLRQVLWEHLSEYPKWKELFGLGAFDRMWRILGETMSFQDASAVLQQNWLRQSKEMQWIPKGTFQMGPANELQRQVTITKDFWMSRYPITDAFWESLMNPKFPSRHGASVAVSEVTWYAAVEFCNRLSVLEGFKTVYSINKTSVKIKKTGNGYRLPTQAEWEMAARGGEGFIYAGSNELNEVAWTKESIQDHPFNYLQRMQADINAPRRYPGVGLKKANGFGLYDMSGNVQEWCWDRNGYPNPENVIDPMEPIVAGKDRVLRGGDVWSTARDAQVCARWQSRKPYQHGGFRIVRVAT